MLATILPMTAILLLFIAIAMYNYTTKEPFANAREQDEKVLKEIQMKVKLNPVEEQKAKRMFQAYWKVTKESARSMVQNTFEAEDIPSWVKTPKDVKLLYPHIIPFMMGQKDSLPNSREEAVVEKFSNQDQDDETHLDLDKVDEMTDKELEDSFRKSKMKKMTPRQAEEYAYRGIKHLANADFNDKFYNSLSYVIMSFAEQAAPDAKPEDLRNLGVNLKQQLPPAIQSIQMDARSLFRKVEQQKQQEMNKRRKQKKSYKSQKAARLDREGYMKSLPKYKRTLIEGFVGKSGKEPFILKGIFSAILKPVIEGLMPLVTGLIETAVKVFLDILPTLINQVFIPLLNTVIELVTKVLTNKQIMEAIINIIKKLINMAIDIGYKIIQALSIPIIKLFFKDVAPLIINAVRFLVFMFRMAVRLSLTVYNMIVSLVKKNWRYIIFMYNWVVNKAQQLLIFVYNYLEPYVAYIGYIITPILLIFILVQVGSSFFSFLNTIVALGMTSTPERTFRPTEALIQNV